MTVPQRYLTTAEASAHMWHKFPSARPARKARNP